jgi:hypothetical protein
MEDALKRLDKLTQEEARMAVAQNLKATHSVDERVRGVASTVIAMDNRVAHVDDKVAEVIHGVQVIFCRTSAMLNLNTSDGKETKQVINQTNQVVTQTANDVDLMKRS